ncbi:zinc finger CCHC domain-containing protein 17-like [Carassius carassius]|uniref:zinc finger CCHC domain-containing protein 17-like n=1 Tax=Carassius carassius TaxID=217509 RepID=UPI0028696CCA|nr:zinc finger CCHC domain-containing protein 17-like [Carassius carassius]XP_059412284.1 zinc finger CCHC domain-containing protein 17-like [Carassius carassius]
MAEERMREPAGLDELPAMYSILKGEVVSVTTYAAFVKIPGYKKQGLVHKSEMSSCRVENPAEIVDVGEQVWIKVIGREMKDDKVKLSFSMKSVNQGTGRDLDPNNVIAEQDERRRRQFVLNTTCKKCGCRGHFAKDCFSQPGLQYSLVPEEEEEEPPKTSQQTQSEPQKRKKEKKAKKDKKKKKEKKRDRSSSDSNDEVAKRPQHSHTHSEKKKKHKKHKTK